MCPTCIWFLFLTYLSLHHSVLKIHKNKGKQHITFLKSITLLWWPPYFAVVSAQFIRSVISDYLQPHGLQLTRPPCPSPTPWAYSNSSPWSQWCHPTISCSVVPFYSLLKSFPASGSFQMTQFFNQVSKVLEFQL